MSLPYQNATTGDRALKDIQKTLHAFGCKRFAHGHDYETGDVFIQFEHRGRTVYMKASARGYAAAWLRENPWSYRRKGTKDQWHDKALKVGRVAVYSMLRDWVKSNTSLIEAGLLTFEEVFLSQMMLPDGRRVIDRVEEEKMLPMPEGSADAD